MFPAFKIEVAVIGDIQDRILIALCLDLIEKSRAVKLIDDRELELSGETLFPVRGNITVNDLRFAFLNEFKDTLGLIDDPAVQTVGTVVDGELVFLSVQGEAGFADAVGTTSDRCPEAGTSQIGIGFKAVKAENDIAAALLFSKAA